MADVVRIGLRYGAVVPRRHLSRRDRHHQLFALQMRQSIAEPERVKPETRPKSSLELPTAASPIVSAAIQPETVPRCRSCRSCGTVAFTECARVQAKYLRGHLGFVHRSAPREPKRTQQLSLRAAAPKSAEFYHDSADARNLAFLQRSGISRRTIGGIGLIWSAIEPRACLGRLRRLSRVPIALPCTR
jgi:hypothetical protein